MLEKGIELKRRENIPLLYVFNELFFFRAAYHVTKKVISNIWAEKKNGFATVLTRVALQTT